MTLSVNTNEGALLALQNLNATGRELNVVQNRINTGLAVASAKDDGAIFAIAQNLRADLGGLRAVKGSLDRGISVVEVAIAAAESISDILIELKAKAVAATDASLDTASRDALNNDFVSLRDQITTIVRNAEFNGINMLNSSDAAAVTAITNADGTSTITVAAQDLALSSANVTLSSNEVINTATKASAVVSLIDTSLANVNNSLGVLGTGAKSLERQRVFADKLSDVIEVGIGNLVDADLAKESARLQALQVKQQLGVQALSIANQAPSIILSLFR